MRAQISFFRNYAARGAGLALAVGLASSFSMGARAFEVSEAQREACTPDAFRLCGAYIPDSDRVATCMQANVPNLSPACRAVFQTAQPASDVVQAPRRHVRKITTSYDRRYHHYHRDDDRRGTWARD
ncbi:MAG: hypothetical protein WDN29_08810 [Methylovirgula sp.]